MCSAKNDRGADCIAAEDVNTTREPAEVVSDDDHFLGFDIHEVLIGTSEPEADLALLRERFVSGGGDSADFTVFDGQGGLDQLRSHGDGAEPMRTFRHLMRHLDGLDANATGHVLASADADLTAGRRVVAIRGVAKHDAQRLAALLRAGGVPHVHYVGKWTTIENGRVPIS